MLPCACGNFAGGLLLSVLATTSCILDHYLRRSNAGFAIGFTSVLIIVSTRRVPLLVLLYFTFKLIDITHNQATNLCQLYLSGLNFFLGNFNLGALNCPVMLSHLLCISLAPLPEYWSHLSLQLISLPNRNAVESFHWCITGSSSTLTPLQK